MTLLSIAAARIIIVTGCLAFAGCAPSPSGTAPASAPTELSISAAGAHGSEPGRAPAPTEDVPSFGEPSAAPWRPVAVATRYRFSDADAGGPLAGFAGPLDRPPADRA